MGPHEDETERYLRKFQPRQIRQLEVWRKRRNILPWRLAATVAVGLLVAGALWLAYREGARIEEKVKVQPSKVAVARSRRDENILSLTRLALTDNEKFESLLTEESRKELPTFRGEQSMLSVLARE